MVKFRLYVENPRQMIKRFWGNDVEDIVDDYVSKIENICSKLFNSIEYCLLYAYNMNLSCGVNYSSYQICQISSEGNISFLSIKEAEKRINKVKVLVDESLMKDKTKIKDFKCRVLDYDSKLPLCDSIHLTNLQMLMNETELQEFTDGKVVFDLPVALLKEFNDKPMDYVSKMLSQEGMSK